LQANRAGWWKETLGKGSNTTTQNTSTSADPQAAATYRMLLDRASGVASTPYQAYTGDLTAPINSQQQQGIAGINANANYASPYITQAAGLAGASSAPVTGSDIAQYYDPYQQKVIDATTAQLQHDNGMQMASLQGNQISQGALGGNATGVAKGILAGQQGRTMASTVSGLESAGFNNALGAAQRQQQTGLAGANALANYGISGQNAALSGAGAQLGAGNLLQQNEQARLNALYGQYAQAQAYPYQQTQWLAGLATGVGSNLGSTSYGQTTGPPPNQTAQYLGAGLTAAGLFLNRGGAVHRAHGGGVLGYADGGVPSTPWANGLGWIPQMQIHGGGAPSRGSAPSLPTQPQFDPSKFATGLAGLGNKTSGKDWSGLAGATMDGSGFSGDAWGGGSFRGGNAWGGSSSSPLPGLDASDYGLGFAGGGGVMGYADGSDVNALDNMAGFTPGMSPVAEEERARGLAALRPRMEQAFPVPSEPLPVFGPDGKMIGNQTSIQGQPRAPEGSPVVAEDDEEAPTPPARGVAPSGAPAGGVMAFAPGSYGSMPDAVTQPQPREKEGFGLGLVSPNAKTGLLTAGLGMLASRSPFLGNAIGEGGLAGVSAYGSAEEHDRKVAAEAQKLAQEARQQTLTNMLNERKQGETERHNKATETTAAKNLDRTKFVPAGQYMGEDGVYRPVVMDQSSGRLIDPANGKPIAADAKIQGKGDTGFTEDEAKDIARRFVVSGDVTDMQGIGPAARLKVARAIKQVQKDLNVSDEELAQRKVEFAGRKAGSRTLGTMEAKMGSAAFEAEGAIKLVRGVIERLPRTAFLPFNQLIEGYSKRTLNPDQAELYARAQAIVNTYSAVMSRGANVVTDSARHHAGELLNTAYDPKTFNRVLDTMLNEIEMAKGSPARMQQFYREHYGPKAVESGHGSAGAATPPGGGSGGFTPPPGAIPRQYNGKTYYYDPNTKQPYPGQ
jgi:hypothetical protein